MKAFCARRKTTTALNIKQKFILLTCILFTCFNTYGQSTQLDSLKELLRITDNSLEKFKITFQLSVLTGNSDARTSLKYAQESMQLANKIQTDTLVNKATLNLANAYLQIGNYPQAFQLYQEIIKNKDSNSNALLAAYTSIGIIYYYQRDYKNALTNYSKALSFFSKTNQETDLEKLLRKEKLLNSLGILYEEMKEFDKANTFYTEALNITKQINNLNFMAHVLTNHARLYHRQGKDELALKYYLEALEIRKKVNDKLGLALSYDSLGEFYFELKDYSTAELYLKEAIILGQGIGDLLTVRRSSSNLYKLYQQQGKYKKAFNTLALNKQVSDTLFNAERSNKIAQLEMQFEFDKKQREAQAKQREKELNYLLGALGLGLSLIIVSLLYYLQRNKVKRSMLEQAHLKLEKKNLEKDIELKDKELTTNILHLMQKNELIDDISEKLLKIKQNVGADSQPAVQKVVMDLQSNLRPELLQEFEFRFQQVHEDFYVILNEKFPNLSPSERKLCAFLKLNMTTKEISAITHQSIKTIEIARTRLRKKLNLTGSEHNLVTFLSQLERA
ncbi:tetratricopeptide repeat protein [Solitalea koreensis]|nr:tetratricopeptide repeat protein [Solitalea koreensis]